MLRRRLDLMPQVCACFLDQGSKSIVTFLCHCVRDLVLTRAFKRRNHIHCHRRRRRQDNILFFRRTHIQTVSILFTYVDRHSLSEMFCSNTRVVCFTILHEKFLAVE